MNVLGLLISDRRNLPHPILHIFSAAKKPEITKGIKDVSVSRKRDLKLECHATGEPAPQYIWYKDGQEIIPSNENVEVVLEFLIDIYKTEIVSI